MIPPPPPGTPYPRAGVCAPKTSIAANANGEGGSTGPMSTGCCDRGLTPNPSSAEPHTHLAMLRRLRQSSLYLGQRRQVGHCQALLEPCQQLQGAQTRCTMYITRRKLAAGDNSCLHRHVNDSVHRRVHTTRQTGQCLRASEVPVRNVVLLFSLLQKCCQSNKVPEKALGDRMPLGGSGWGAGGGRWKPASSLSSMGYTGPGGRFATGLSSDLPGTPCFRFTLAWSQLDSDCEHTCSTLADSKRRNL